MTIISKYVKKKKKKEKKRKKFIHKLQFFFPYDIIFLITEGLSKNLKQNKIFNYNKIKIRKSIKLEKYHNRQK